MEKKEVYINNTNEYTIRITNIITITSESWRP